MQKKNHDIFEENWKSWFIILVETAFNPFSYLTQVSPEILTQAKNEAKSPNQSKAIFEYLWVGKV